MFSFTNTYTITIGLESPELTVDQCRAFAYIAAGKYFPSGHTIQEATGRWESPERGMIDEPSPDGGPTPLQQARAMAAKGDAPRGAAAWFVLRADEAWSVDSHATFPRGPRSMALEMLHVGYALIYASPRRWGPHEAGILIEMWRSQVMPYLIQR